MRGRALHLWTIVAYKHDQLEITAQAVQLLLVQKQQLARHGFCRVNNYMHSMSGMCYP